MTTQENKPVKLTITHYRKPEHSHEAFIKWITEEHVPLAMPVFQKHGVIEYSLVSITCYLSPGQACIKTDIW